MLGMLLAPGSARGQATATVRVFNPSTVTLKLGSREPIPPGIVDSLLYGGMGGGGGDDATPTPTPAPLQPRWEYFFDRAIYPSIDATTALTGCGFRTAVVPVATLTYPSGRTETIAGAADGDCYSFPITLKTGQELGDYSLAVTHPDGGLNYAWTLDYPPKPSGLAMNEHAILLTGFQPGETLTLSFYSQSALNNGSNYVATRPVAIGPDGTLLVQINASASSPLNEPSSWNIFTVDSFQGIGNFGKFVKGYAPIARSLYDQAARQGPLSAGYFTVSTFNKVDLTGCTKSPKTRLLNVSGGHVTPGDANNLRDKPGGKIIGAIPGGEFFNIVSGPQCGADGLTWWQVTYKDQKGWTPEGQGTTYWLAPD
jgi:hypothetical protein